MISQLFNINLAIHFTKTLSIWNRHHSCVNRELIFWRSIGKLPVKMIHVLKAYTASYLFLWYSVRYLFELFFCKFQLQRANIILQVLDLSSPCKSSRKMNEQYTRFGTLENKIWQNNSKGILNQKEIFILHRYFERIWAY